MTLRILLADDHAMMREALRFFIALQEDINVVAAVGNGREALRQAEETSPDLVLMDVDMPDMDGIEATQQIVWRQPGIKVLGLSAHPDKQKVLAMLEAGAAGYLIKSEAGEELFRAIHAVMGGQTYLCPLASALMAETPDRKAKTGKPRLAPREREVLSLVAQGLHSPAIGKRLSIAASTVEVHRRNIARKVGLHGTAELTKYAIREGLITT